MFKMALSVIDHFVQARLNTYRANQLPVKDLAGHCGPAQGSSASPIKQANDGEPIALAVVQRHDDEVQATNKAIQRSRDVTAYSL